MVEALEKLDHADVSLILHYAAIASINLPPNKRMAFKTDLIDALNAPGGVTFSATPVGFDVTLGASVFDALGRHGLVGPAVKR